MAVDTVPAKLLDPTIPVPGDITDTHLLTRSGAGWAGTDPASLAGITVSADYLVTGGIPAYDGSAWKSGLNSDLLEASLPSYWTEALSEPAKQYITWGGGSGVVLGFDAGAAASGTVDIKTPAYPSGTVEAYVASSLVGAADYTSMSLRLLDDSGKFALVQHRREGGGYSFAINATTVGVTSSIVGDATMWIGFVYNTATGLITGYYDLTTAMDADPGAPTSGGAWTKYGTTKTLPQGDLFDPSTLTLRCTLSITHAGACSAALRLPTNGAIWRRR